MTEDSLTCEYCGRQSTPENPVAWEATWDVSGKEAIAALCEDANDCSAYVRIHGNDEQMAKWHYS